MRNIMNSKLLKASAIVVMLFAATIVSAADYTIKQNGQADVTGTFTGWKPFIDVLNAHNVGTADNRVTATISGATMADDTGRGNEGGQQGNQFFLLASDSFAYTDIIFENCTFSFNTWQGMLFDEAEHPGNCIKFYGCQFSTTGGSVYGIGRHASDASYTYDFVFKNCMVNGLGSGGMWFGDVTIEDCTVGMVNMNCGYNDQNSHNSYNSFGQPATLTIKNTTFTNPEVGYVGVYANMFPNYVYQAKTGETDFLYAYNGNGFYSQMTPFICNLLSATGSCTYTSTGAQTAFYVFNSMHVRYDGNGGTGSVVDKNTYFSDGETTILNNGFTYAGHAFTGWNTKADGTGTNYAPGDKVTIKFAENLELYAQWAELSRLTITASGLAEGESAVFTVNSSAGDVDTPLLQVMIAGEAGGGGSRTVFGLATGDYKVVPASWSWTYDIDKESIDVTLDGTNPAEAEFTLTKKDSTLPENVEKVKVSNF